MVISTHGARPRIDAAALDFNNTAPNSGSAGSLNSFAQQLLTTIESYLNKSGSGSNLEVDIQGTPSQNSGGNSQFVVTVKNLGNAVATPPAASTSPRVSAPLSPALVVAPPIVAPAPAAVVPAAATAASPASVTPAAAPAAVVDKSKMTPDQAYWAEQPPAVQALQYTPDDQRGALAEQLASQGYTIDVPIMVWNWDPLATMVQRQIDGYSWVPSLQQPAIAVAPGVSFPGSPSYDPSKPPAGSIAVTTAFAKGTNGQDAWIKNVDTTTGTVAIQS
jgi:hypothetical protein